MYRLKRQAVKIEPDYNGLVNYFGAHNIRNKIRHPLFLALKFHQIISLHYNKALFAGKSQREIVIDLQKSLLQVVDTTEVDDKQFAEASPTEANVTEETKFLCLFRIEEDPDITGFSQQSIQLKRHLFNRKLQPLSNNVVTFALSSQQDLPMELFAPLNDF